jgi:hypothetical protein
MSWLARRWLTAGLCRIGHRPEWLRYMSGGRFASCWDCGRSWDAVTFGQVTETLRRVRPCKPPSRFEGNLL